MNIEQLPIGTHTIQRDRADVWFRKGAEITVTLGGTVRGTAWTGMFMVTTPDPDEWAALIDVVNNPQIKAAPHADYIAGTAYLNTTPKRNRK
jgi:hypothetical protein